MTGERKDREEMTSHLQREIERLKRKVLALSAVVEDSLREAFVALEQRDGLLARRVIEGDVEIDEIEVDIEEDCLKILALHQPVAGDLRFIVAVIKLNHRLERLGDLAASIAKRAAALVERPFVPTPPLLFEMAEKSGAMIERALDALVKGDTTLAKLVLAADDEVDDIYVVVTEELKDAIRTRPESLDALVEVFAVARYLERIADHATNIAEDVIYMNEGEIARHKAGVFEFDRAPEAKPAGARHEETA
jgi:phosphate transport system protein